MSECRVCASGEITTLLDFGMQPICNRFLKSTTEKDYEHPLVVMLCNSCGLMQLANAIPATALKPLHDWISYTEHEEHLDNLADVLSQLFDSKNPSICAISYKDDSLLERMKKRGFQGFRLEPKKDLGAESDYGSVEVIQHLFNTERAKKVVERKGKFDLVLARHILEHAADIHEFMKAIRELLKPNGYALFEVPDCTKPLEKFDYSTIWEEHLIYLTPETFKNCFARGGFSLEKFEVYPYSIENSLDAIVRPAEIVSSSIDKDTVQKERKRALTFSQSFAKNKNMIKDFFSDYNKSKGKIAVFGAGHSASVLINLFDLKDYIAYVIDDNEKKQGLFMPGSHLPIVGSGALKDANLSVFSVNPDVEEKIITKNKDFKGTFLSFSPVSKQSLQAQLPRKFRKGSKELYNRKHG